MSKIEQEKICPGFKIMCDKCKDYNVYVDNSMGFSDLSGSWGSVDLICNDCDNRATIVES